MKLSLLKRICGVAMSEAVQMSDGLILGQWSLGSGLWAVVWGKFGKAEGNGAFIFGQNLEVGRGAVLRCVVVEETGMGRKKWQTAEGGLPGVGDEQVNVSPSTAVCSVNSEDRRDLSIVNDPMKSRVDGANCRCWCRVSVPR